MELEILGIGKSGPVHDNAKKAVKKKQNHEIRPVIKETKNSKTTKEIVNQIQKKIDKIDASKYLQDILKISSFFNRRLKFSVDQNLNQVIVKVIDKKTDKVIKEIPPEQLKRLYAKMKEAMGLIIDTII